MQPNLLTDSAHEHAPATLWRQFRDGTAPLWEALAGSRLLPRQRMALGGSLFVGAADFVYAVAEGLGVEEDRCAYVPGQGRSLKRRQDRSLELRFLSRGLRDLAQLVDDAYVQEQSGAIQDAMMVMQRLRQEQGRPFLAPSEDLAHRRRAAHLYPAQKMLSDRQRRHRRKALRKKLRSVR